jgi:hypothetical protein
VSPSADATVTRIGVAAVMPTGVGELPPCANRITSFGPAPIVNAPVNVVELPVAGSVIDSMTMSAP